MDKIMCVVISVMTACGLALLALPLRERLPVWFHHAVPALCGIVGALTCAYLMIKMGL